MDQVNEIDFVKPSIVFQIGVPPGRVDILTAVSGLVFEAAWKNRFVIALDDFSFPVIGYQDLIINKRASGRPKDIADLHSLEGGNPG